LFDIIVELLDSEVTQDGKLNAKISLINFGIPGGVEVKLVYTVYDSQGNEVLTTYEVLTLETQTEFLKTFNIPGELNPGWYHLDIKLLYGDEQEAYSTTKFNIDQGTPLWKMVPLSAWALFSLLIAMLAGAMGLHLWSNKKLKEKKDKKDKEKK